MGVVSSKVGWKIIQEGSLIRIKIKLYLEDDTKLFSSSFMSADKFVELCTHPLLSGKLQKNRFGPRKMESKHSKHFGK